MVETIDTIGTDEWSEKSEARENRSITCLPLHLQSPALPKQLMLGPLSEIGDYIGLASYPKQSDSSPQLLIKLAIDFH